MRKTILILVLLLTAQVFFGQEELSEIKTHKLSEDKIEEGKPYPSVVSYFNNYFTYEELILSVKVFRSNVILQTYNTNTLSEENVKVYDDFPKTMQIEEIIKVNDRIFLFYSINDEVTKKITLFSREIDVKNCSFMGDVKAVIEVKNNCYSTLNTYDVMDRFCFSTSFDQRKLLIHYVILDDAKTDLNLGLQMFNQDLMRLWKKDLTIPYAVNRMGINSCAIDSKGNVYMTSFIYRDDSRKNVKLKKVNYTNKLFKITAETGELSQSKIQLDNNKHIYSLSLFQADKNRIICTGYASECKISGANYNQISNVFKFEVNDEPIEIDFYEIPIKIANQNVNKKTINKNLLKVNEGIKPVVNDLTPKSIYMVDDGGIILIGEQQFRGNRIRHMGNPGTGYRSFYILFRDILATKINKDGSLEWMKKMTKMQEPNKVKLKFNFNGRDDKGFSFRVIDGREHLYFVFVDKKKNLNMSMTDIPDAQNSGRSGSLTAYKLDLYTGEVEKISLFEDAYKIKGVSCDDFNISKITSSFKDQFIFEILGPKHNNLLFKINLK